MGKTNYTGIAILAAIGIVGFGLLKSDFFKGLGNIGSGVGTAAQGLGGGVSDVAGDIAQTTGNIADFLNPLGIMGTQAGKMIEQASEQAMEYGEVKGEGIIERADIRQDEKTKRAQIRQEDRTQDLIERKENGGGLFSFIRSGSFLSKFNPLSLLTSWIGSRASVEAEEIQEQSITQPETFSITGGAVSESSTGSGGVSSPQKTSYVRSTGGTSSATQDADISAALSGKLAPSTIETARIFGITPAPVGSIEPTKTPFLKRIGGFFRRLF